jgi:hypothetical protein
MDLDKFRKKAEEEKKVNQKFLNNLKKKKVKNLDNLFHKAHEEVFEKINCLDCANCCKTTSPIFKNRDIQRISKYFRMKSNDFIDKYLKIDDENDYVLKSSPCPFLDDDNYCGIYDVRPDACAEFPHTDRRKMSQIINLTYRNTLVCPAVLEIVNKLKIKSN